MKVFKFGGASVKDADALRNVSSILSAYAGEKLLVIVSAMGKTTNKLEEIVQALYTQDHHVYNQSVDALKQAHINILNALFQTKHPIFETCNSLFDLLTSTDKKPDISKFSFEYDQIVSIGELISSHILTAFLIQEGHAALWSDARQLIRTDNTFQEGNVDWDTTESLIKKQLMPNFEQFDIQITQGFIGHTKDGYTTTLGREGSDYTAGIVAYCTNAEQVVIWKDVPGMLNADPKFFENTVKLEQISFREAIELSYYGASVIHPKTIKPLQNKGIPLFVKSFLQPKEVGTIIQSSTEKDHLVPSFIVKKDQVLFSITTRDFSFIVEEHLRDIFERLARMKQTINLMQNSALDFSILLDRAKIDPELLLQEFNDDYTIRYNEGLELVTIRHYDQNTMGRLTNNKEIILEQKTRQTARLVLKNK
jgi:aspartate kinase